MTDYFALSLPIFAVIAIGWGSMRSGQLPAATVDVLGAFSFRVAEKCQGDVTLICFEPSPAT